MKKLVVIGDRSIRASYAYVRCKNLRKLRLLPDYASRPQNCQNY